MSENTKKILMGAFMAALGAVATYAVEALPSVAIPPVLLPIVSTGLGALINALRKSPLFGPKPVVVPPPVPVPTPDVLPTPDTEPTDWRDLIRRMLADALRNAVVAGNAEDREKLTNLIDEVAD